jgi:hypothetical protein
LILKLAIAFLERVRTGLCPVMVASSSIDFSKSLISVIASPTPMLTTIFLSRGTCIELLYPISLTISGMISFR